MLEKGIGRFYLDAVKVGLKNPRFLLTALSIFLNQRAAVGRRSRSGRSGLAVPPFMILSITSRCNLGCKGCYSKIFHRDKNEDVSRERIASLLGEAENLGIATILLAGGEPLLRQDILDLTAEFPRLLFVVFTNGTLIDERFLAVCRRRGNLIPVISIEGDRNVTDMRRGEGVFAKATESIEKFRAGGIFCGISLTVTKKNIAEIATREFVDRLRGSGCRLFFFVDYVPVEPGSTELSPGPDERRTLSAAVAHFRTEIDALFISFPGDEEQFGGCLAAGRGFIHVNPGGDLEACPLAPFSDVNINETRLQEALASPLLKRIRENPQLLEETAGGCALFAKRETVSALIEKP